MTFDPGLDVRVSHHPLGFSYGPTVFGPPPEYRTLDSIRPSLFDPTCEGPDPVYAIAMDVGRKEHREELQRRMLLFGVVSYASGRLGREPVRSQGHVHRVSRHSGWSPPEIYEVWTGRAVVYMQEFAADDPGRCFAVSAEPGEVVVVPPGWPHATISADPMQPLTFGAWCDREYGFAYEEVRARGGLAWFPLLGGDAIELQRNARYRTRRLEVCRPRAYHDLDLTPGSPIYRQFAEHPDCVQWVSDPAAFHDVWDEFRP